jgi:transcriptional regulator with XRE-family HTH domain
VAHDATKRRLQLGFELAKARQGAGMTQHRAAAVLGCTQSKINKIETDTVAISKKDLDALLRNYAPSEALVDRIRLLAAQAKAGPSAGAPANKEYLKLLAYEPAAHEILVFHTERIPNVLQSEQFLLEQYQLADQLYDVPAIAQSREEREQLFTTPRPPKYRAVFSPSAFYRTPGGRSAAFGVGQIDHVLRMMADYEQHLFVHILPWEANVPYVPHDLTILRFAGEHKDLVYSERGAGESRIYDGRDEVTTQIKHWNNVFAEALSVDDTRKFLRELRDEARTW